MWLDLVHAARVLARSTRFTVAASLILAVGIGSTTTLFSLVYHTLLRPLPFDDTGLVHMMTGMTTDDLPAGEVSFLDYLDWKERASSFDAMTAVGASAWGLYVRRGTVDTPVIARLVASNFFDMLDAEIPLGRGLVERDDRPGAEPVMIVSHRFWLRHLGADPNVVGERVRVAGRMDVSHMASELGSQFYPIVGVTEPAFRFPDDADVWIPGGPFFGTPEMRIQSAFQIIGRLERGVSIERARSEMHAIVKQLGIDYRGTDKLTIAMVPLTDRLFGAARPALYALFAAAGIMLLIACGNVAGLMLARTTWRRDEIRIRASLGASPSRIARLLLAQSAWLTMLGAAAGLVLARGLLGAIVYWSPVALPRLWTVRIDGVVLGGTIAIAGLATILAVLPSLRFARRAFRPVRSSALANGLVASQLGMTAVLLVLAALSLRTFVVLADHPLGFVADDVLTLDVNLPSDRYPDTRAKNAFLRGLKERVVGLPGVVDASAVLVRPLEPGGTTVGWDFYLIAEGQPIDASTAETNPWVNWESVMPDYSRTMRIPIVAGREFEERDDEEGPSVVIVSEGLARHMWPGEDAVGKRLLTYGNRGRDAEGNRQWQTVVGVAGDVDYRGLRERRMDIYVPYRQSPKSPQHLVVRARDGTSDAVSSALGRVLVDLDPELPARVAFSMASIVSRALAPWRFGLYVLGLFGVAALALSSAGVVAVLAFGVAERRREIGIRIALGASRDTVIRLFVRQGLRLVGIGLVAGLAVGWQLERVARRFVSGIEPAGYETYLAVALVLGAVAGLAIAVPASAAGTVDAARALRSD